MSVTLFKYTAVDASGAKARGTLRAAGQQEAYRKLSVSGLTPLSLEEVAQRGPLWAFHRVSTQDIVGLTRELAVLVEAKIPLDRGLLSIAEHEANPALAGMIRDIATTVESGAPLAQAFEKHRRVFGDVYVETMRAAEKAGNLEAVTAHLADMLDRQMETRSQFRRAMAYPVIVLCMVAAALTVVVGFVVPKFATTFNSAGARLPLATRIVQGIGTNMHEYWWAYALGLAGAIVALVMGWRHPRGRCVLEDWLTRIPHIGRIVICSAAARYARVMGIGLQSGLDVIDAMQIAGRSTGRPVFASDCDAMARRLSKGERLGEVLNATRYLPPFARRMIGAGKDSKEVSRACDIVARHYDREANHLTRNINTIIEPLLTVGLAAIVLVVALAVFLPMWQMARVRR